MLKSLVAAAAALVMAAPAAAQTVTVTVNGHAFDMPTGATATFVTDENGTRMVSTTQVAAASLPAAAPRPAVYYAPPPAPRIEYTDPDAGSVEPAIGGGQVLRIRRDRMSGHFIAPVVMNGVRVKAIIDTGASGTILSPEDAVATGADRDVRSSRPGVGIGGYTTLYMTRVRDLEIGGQRLGAFDADIGQRGIPHTLLGTPQLTRLGRIVIEGDVMTIYPKGVEMASPSLAISTKMASA